MLLLKPNCEWCDKNLPANATDALICSYECTFCANCVSTLLNNVCPNCGGGFVPRPIRPQHAYRKGTSVKQQTPASVRQHSPYSEKQIKAFVAKIRDIDPNQR